MLRNWKKLLAGAAALLLACVTTGFSLLGPGGGEGIAAKEWQLPAQNDGWDIGYNLAGDIGAPVSLGEFYRWNTPTITYAFDSSFITYFGSNGIKAVDAAMRILNEVPHVSKMSDDLSEFPLSSLHVHPEAAELGLVDLKSGTLQIMMEQIGLADPIRWNYSIRQRINLPDDFGSYFITRYNYDPVTLEHSSYVNGNLWTYFILEIPPPTQYSEAVEVRPVTLANEPVNFPVAANTYTPTLSGIYFTSLTRDDVGGIRYLLRPRNMVNETLLPDVGPGTGFWSPYLGTNVLTNAVGATNAGSAGLRGGIGKLRFRKVFFDNLIGQTFTPVDYRYTDNFIATNGLSLRQSVQRRVIVPDIIFSAGDIFPAMFARTTTAGWINNDLINGILEEGGPGVIAPPIVITFDNSPRLLFNQTPFFVTEPFINDPTARNNSLLGPQWASFDGSTNDPVIYPAPLGYTVRSIRNMVGGNP